MLYYVPSAGLTIIYDDTNDLAHGEEQGDQTCGQCIKGITVNAAFATLAPSLAEINTQNFHKQIP